MILRKICIISNDLHQIRFGKDAKVPFPSVKIPKPIYNTDLRKSRQSTVSIHQLLINKILPNLIKIMPQEILRLKIKHVKHLRIERVPFIS